MTSIFDSDQFNQNLFFPRSDNSAPPKGAEDIFIKVENNCKIHVRLHRSLAAKFSIMFFHGNGEVASDYNNIYPHTYEQGINLFAAEYRGYSSSYGTPTYSTMLSDAHHIYRYFREYLERQSFTGKAFVMGRSLGTAPALELAAYYQDYFDGVIIESGSGGSKGWDRWFQSSTDRSTLVNLQVSHAEKLKRIYLPLLSIHGELDSMVPVKSVFELQDMVSSKVKEIAIIPNVGHNTIFLRGMNQYMDALRSFITTA